MARKIAIDYVGGGGYRKDAKSREGALVKGGINYDRREHQPDQGEEVRQR
jgi:hypothetical protein